MSTLTDDETCPCGQPGCNGKEFDTAEFIAEVDRELAAGLYIAQVRHELAELIATAPPLNAGEREEVAALFGAVATLCGLGGRS